ncbi:TetR/AcrR family transcriptional regulator [Paenibacillus protaetiae]|uniref:TetR/AcrR family transcriptional regulator n=1 Tax=Paenibacillus protaetiae TaxID=2509456 RepID=A0A4P6ESI5_9BACL|nr:TetR/AcrR family transcriptional regulator [Paenibacillus protaetiae]QAY65854.1 TetR/AcrR family transcriptional regulator [Paenibacillus protaetiae]
MFEKYNKVQQAILQTTLSLLIEKELQATSMALIAKKSGVSTGSIYHYFESKEAIINELYKAIVTFNGETVLNGFYTDEPIRTRLERAWENMIRLSLRYPEGFQFIEQYSFSPYIYDESKREAYEGGWCGPLGQLYAEAIEAKLFIEMDPHLLVQMHYGSFVYVVKGHLNRHLTLTDDRIKQLIEATWNSAAVQ